MLLASAIFAILLQTLRHRRQLILVVSIVRLLAWVPTVQNRDSVLLLRISSQLCVQRLTLRVYYLYTTQRARSGICSCDPEWIAQVGKAVL